MRCPRIGLRYLQMAALILVAALAGCSSERQVAQARRLLDQDQPEAAIRLLDRKLPKISDRKNLSAAYVALGDALVRVGRVQEAFSAYAKAMQAVPEAIEPQKRTAELLIATGSGDQALLLTEPLAVAHPLDAQLLELNAAAMTAAGNLSSAESIYRRAIALSPTESDLAISLAELLVRQDRGKEARDVLLQATERSKSTAPWLALGRLDEQEGNPIGAEVAYRRAVQAADTPETNFRLAQFLQRAAKISEAQAVLKHVDELNRNAVSAADLSFSLGKATAALEAYVRSLHATDGSRVQDEAAMTSRAVEAALYSSEKSDVRLRNARQILAQNAARLDEGTRAVLETEIALVAGDLALAAKHSRRALEYLPRSAAAHYLSGVVFDSQGNESAAEGAWEEAVDLDDHIPSRMALAQAAMRGGEFDKAQEHIATVVREEPANLQALLIYARVLERERSLDAAQAIVNRALIIDPACVEANVIAGNIAMERKASGAAFISYEKALLFDGRSDEGIAGLLRVFAQGRPTQRSIAKIERMAAAPPQSAMLYEVAGRLYELVGFKNDAQRALRRSLELDAHRPTAELALWRAGARDGGGVRAEVPDPTIRDYEHALAGGDPTGIAANNLAFAYATRGMRLDRALELSLDAVRRMPAKAEPMDTLGFVFLKMRQYTAAADAFEHALELSPDAQARRQILLHLADAYQAGGEEAKATAARAAAGRLRG